MALQNNGIRVHLDDAPILKTAYNSPHRFRYRHGVL